MRAAIGAMGAAVALALAVAACGSSSNDAMTLTVFAAASLTDAFGELADRYEAEHPDVDVVLNTAGSSSLREQILAGAPADVFASASPDPMLAVVEAGATAGPPVRFAQTGLVIVTPVDDPGDVDSVDDLADPARLIGLCADGVPCGVLARDALDRLGVEPSLDTAEPDVRALLTKVVAGELDAGIVYVTDALAAGSDVRTLTLPGAAADVVADYPIAVLADAPASEVASDFVEFVLSADGAAVLAGFGFEVP